MILETLGLAKILPSYFIFWKSILFFNQALFPPSGKECSAAPFHIRKEALAFSLWGKEKSWPEKLEYTIKLPVGSSVIVFLSHHDIIFNPLTSNFFRQFLLQSLKEAHTVYRLIDVALIGNFFLMILFQNEIKILV